MSFDSSRNFNLSPVSQVTGGGLYKKEGLFGHSIIELLRMLRKVAPNGYDLQKYMERHRGNNSNPRTFLPDVTNDAIDCFEGMTQPEQLRKKRYPANRLSWEEMQK